MISVQATFANLLEAVRRGETDAAARLLGAEVVAFLATPDQGLRAELTSLSDAAHVAVALASLGPCRLDVEAQATDGDQHWAEVTRTRRNEVETCLVGVHADPAGAATRLVWFRVGRVPDQAPADEVPAGDGRAAVDTYFHHLMHNRFAAATASFTDNCIYSHPPYRGMRDRVLCVGADALLDAFVNLRGESPVRQVVQTVVQSGRSVFVEGVVEGIPNGGTFAATARLGAGGRIERYVAFYAATRLAIPTERESRRRRVPSGR